ncbi:hypothetical protein WA026_005675 [Henosepilachna vigintioctopunctata]|uniref:Uncharacterized protein n=1 Tax=Henosepilachna vigintioctopunctata TaxID=420089 RepID=A0AAW1U667_9CUCU
MIDFNSKLRNLQLVDSSVSRRNEATNYMPRLVSFEGRFLSCFSSVQSEKAGNTRRPWCRHPDMHLLEMKISTQR